MAVLALASSVSRGNTGPGHVGRAAGGYAAHAPAQRLRTRLRPLGMAPGTRRRARGYSGGRGLGSPDSLGFPRFRPPARAALPPTRRGARRTPRSVAPEPSRAARLASEALWLGRGRASGFAPPRCACSLLLFRALTRSFPQASARTLLQNSACSQNAAQIQSVRPLVRLSGAPSPNRVLLLPRAARTCRTCCKPQSTALLPLRCRRAQPLGIPARTTLTCPLATSGAARH